MNPFKAVASAWNGFFNKKFWGPSIGGSRTVSRETVSEDTALNYSAVWCATRLLCGTMAGLPLPIYRGIRREEREKARNHPLFGILNNASNHEQTSYTFRSIMTQWQVNGGNAFAEIEREGNDPEMPVKNLWPLHPAGVQVNRDDNGVLYYKIMDENTREWKDVDAEWIFHLPSIITFDGIVGRGIITHARESIGAGIAAEKYGAHWFGGAAVPRAVVKTPGKWDPEARENFRKEWDEIYSGPDGHRMALLQGGAEIQPLSLSAEDSQFLETRQFGVEEIARWYGVPPHMLQHLLRATFNNIEHLGIEFVQFALIPWLRIWEQAIWKQLLTESERRVYFAEHNVDALMRGDSVSRANFYQSMVSGALMTRNEARKLENLPPVPGGDTFLVQGAMVPLDSEGNPVSKFAESSNQPSQPSQDMGAKLQRILANDLTRMRNIETVKITKYAKMPERFVYHVDTFYEEHKSLVAEATRDSLSAFSLCGMEIESAKFVATWIDEGKNLILDASGIAHNGDLASVINDTLQSEDWVKRPERAVERVG